MSKFPEHEKLRAVWAQARTLGEFIDFLDQEGMAICERTPHVRHGHEWERTPLSNEVLVARFFGIDEKKLAAEKDAMYRQLGGDNG